MMVKNDVKSLGAECTSVCGPEVPDSVQRRLHLITVITG